MSRGVGSTPRVPTSNEQAVPLAFRGSPFSPLALGIADATVVGGGVGRQPLHFGGPVAKVSCRPWLVCHQRSARVVSISTGVMVRGWRAVMTTLVYSVVHHSKDLFQLFSAVPAISGALIRGAQESCSNSSSSRSLSVEHFWPSATISSTLIGAGLSLSTSHTRRFRRFCATATQSTRTGAAVRKAYWPIGSFVRCQRSSGFTGSERRRCALDRCGEGI